MCFCGYGGMVDAQVSDACDVTSCEFKSHYSHQTKQIQTNLWGRIFLFGIFHF